MKALKSLAIALLVLGIGSAAQAQLKVSENDNTKLYITVNTVGTAQALDHKNAFDTKGAELAKVSAGLSLIVWIAVQMLLLSVPYALLSMAVLPLMAVELSKGETSS